MINELLQCKECGHGTVPRSMMAYEFPLEYVCDNCERSLKRACAAIKAAAMDGALKGRTKAQLREIIRVVRWQGPNNLTNVTGEIGYADTVLLHFQHILIGVEADGHAHS